MRINRTTLITIATLSTLTVAGCSGATPPTNTAPSSTSSTQPGQVAAEHNPADITFAQGMIPHHQQAIDMADLATDRASSAKVKDLAFKIKQAQDPEIEQLKQMLEAWGAPEQPDSGGSMPGMGHGGSSGDQSAMPNMMTDQQMQQLENGNGAGFDKMFLEMMIMHHQGAIKMAESEVSQGQNPQAKTLAKKIIEDQLAEISTMQNLLKSS